MIYLDSAATTLDKPAAVSRAVLAALRHGANAGRGTASGYADDTLLDCRLEAAALFGASAEHISFTMNATHALNIAINTLAKTAKTAVISGFEHNAVRRPLIALARSQGLKTTVVRAPLFEPEQLLFGFERALERGADFAVCTHVSNAFGYILPIERLDALCARFGVPLIVDASQSAGVLDLDVSALKAARFVAMPGHKGLYGPQGTGLLISLGDADPLIFGGTGQDSRSPFMPDYLPERLEAGTQNLPGIAGLAEGIRFVRRRTPRAILAHERAFARRLIDELRLLPRLRPLAATAAELQTGVLSLALDALPSPPLGGSYRLDGAGGRVAAAVYPEDRPRSGDPAATAAPPRKDGAARRGDSSPQDTRSADRTCGAASRGERHGDAAPVGRRGESSIAETPYAESDASEAGALCARRPTRPASCEALAEALMRRGIATRAGLHCAPLAHECAGTLERGTLRISPSAFTRLGDAERVARALRDSLAEL